MQPWVTQPAFTVEPPQAKSEWPSVAPPVSPWGKPVEVQAYQNDENLKKQFGIELAKAANSFEAGCKVFGEDTGKALWASANWVNDPVVIAARDIYLKTVELTKPSLDREQLATKVLVLAEGEKILINGVMRSTIEAKDRITAFKLYSDILGYTGKVEIDNSTHNTIKELTIKLVKPEEKSPIVIDNASKAKSELNNENSSPIQLKLVKAS